MTLNTTLINLLTNLGIFIDKKQRRSLIIPQKNGTSNIQWEFLDFLGLFNESNCQIDQFSISIQHFCQLTIIIPNQLKIIHNIFFIQLNHNNFIQFEVIMKKLDEFKTFNHPPIFPNAKTLPTFFQDNLKHPARVVKCFTNDPLANMRIFYFQYLKLCFQMENADFQSYIKRIEDIINNDSFHFIFSEDDNPLIYNDLQFKHLLMDFFGVLGTGDRTIQEAIDQYPIMDTVFIYFFRSILILTGKAEGLDQFIQRQYLFQFLCEYFNVLISSYQKCIKFEDTDIFVYEDDPKEVYMAFMDYEDQQSNETNQITPSQGKNHIFNSNDLSIFNSPATHHSPKDHKCHSSGNKSYISSQFLDYTKTNADFDLNKLTQNEKKSQIYTLNSFIQTPINEKKVDHSYDNGVNQLLIPTNTHLGVQINAFSKPSSQISNSKIKEKEQNLFVENAEKQTPTQPEGQSIFNKNLASKIKKPNSFVPAAFKKQTKKQDFLIEASKTSTIQTASNQKQANTNQFGPTPNKLVTSSSRSNIEAFESKQLAKIKSCPINYKPQKHIKNIYGLNVSIQFTNSFTMKAMAEPYRNNVKTIRNRARQFRSSLSGMIK